MKDKKLYTIIIVLAVIILVLIAFIINQNSNSTKNVINSSNNETEFNIDGCLLATYDSKNNTLYINLNSNGKGKYVKTCVAYELGERSNTVKHIIVEDGVTSVFGLEDSQNKFYNLEDVTLADTVVYFENLQNYTFETGN